MRQEILLRIRFVRSSWPDTFPKALRDVVFISDLILRKL